MRRLSGNTVGMETRGIAAAANTVVPAILALEACGFRVFSEDDLVVQAVIAELVNPAVHNKRVAVIPAAG